jgi:hypothetical protein
MGVARQAKSADTPQIADQRVGNRVETCLVGRLRLLCAQCSVVTRACLPTLPVGERSGRPGQPPMPSSRAAT